MTKQKVVLFNTTENKHLEGIWREPRALVAKEKGNLLVRIPGFTNSCKLQKISHTM